MVSNGFDDGWGGGIPKITSLQLLAAEYRSKSVISTPQGKAGKNAGAEALPVWVISNCKSGRAVVCG